MATPIEIELKQVALQIANEIQARALQLKPELEKIKFRQLEIEDRLKSADLCRERVRNFRPEIDGNLQCPSCWVRNEAKVAMTSIGSDMQDDLFRCSRCGQEVEIEMGLS